MGLMATIKRYSNRKLYDTEAKRYITLEGIAERIRRGDEVHVIDHNTGEDLTALIQAQILFEQEKRTGGGLPKSLLSNLIQTGNSTLKNLQRALTSGFDWETHLHADIERRVNVLIAAGEWSEKEGRLRLQQLLAVPPDKDNQGLDTVLQRWLHHNGVPTKRDIDALNRQLETLMRALEENKQPRSQA